MSFTIGSLFDGSGGFPLAATMCGGTPKWASEVEPYPIAVTKSRFPSMKHLGSVTDIKGGEVEPVDVITFGSPCQDLSVAGKRAGLKHEANGDDETTRSGLFMEAVRIIKEMREATNGVYPRFALWENVPGAFSSNKGEDFRIVLEELIKVVEPTAVMPEVPKNGWPYADSYCGDGWSIAYRVLDAQFWGVPQRRRRIYLVADFRGECAGKVSFEREGLRGYFETGRTPWQTVAGDAEGGTRAADCEGVGLDIYNLAVTGEVAASLTTATGQGASNTGPSVIVVDQGGGKSGANFHDNLSPTLTCTHGGEPAVAYALDQQGGKGGANYAVEVMPTLCSDSHGTPHAVAYSQLLLDDQGGSQISVRDDGKCPTLRAEMHGNLPCVMDAVGVDVYNQALTGDKAKTLNSAASDADHIPCTVYSIENHPADSRVDIDESGKVQTLTSRMGTGGGNVPMVMEGKPVYCLHDNGIDRADTAGCNGKGWKEDTCYTLNTIDRPAVAYLANGEQVSGTLCAGAAQRGFSGGQEIFGGEYHIIEETPPPIRYIVRRLTPTECARLQGFPDTWGHPIEKTELTDEEYQFWMNVRNTHVAINGKVVKDYTKDQMLKWYNGLHTDSSEYKMWGNGIALPNALYVMQGIADVMSEEKTARRKWLDDLLGDCL